MFRLALIVFFCSQILSAQPLSGYWDKDRSFTKEITLKAGKRQVVSVTDLPFGTTEMVYRITILDENQQLSNSLFSLLKSIPDPSGVSQGAAGSVFLLSKISGDDKCNFAVFGDAASVEEFTLNGATKKACFFTESPVSKFAGRFTETTFQCIDKKLFFGFESKNWVFSQKIVLEVVPWVDAVKKLGWTSNNKKEILELAKTGGIAKKMNRSADFCACILDAIVSKFSYQQYKELLAEEKMRIFAKSGTNCLTNRQENAPIIEAIRSDVNGFIKENQFNRATDLLNTTIFSNNLQQTQDVNTFVRVLILSKRFDDALRAVTQNEKLSNTETQVLKAHALTLKGKTSEALKIYRAVYEQSLENGTSVKSMIQNDFTKFSALKLSSENLARVLRKLE